MTPLLQQPAKLRPATDGRDCTGIYRIEGAAFWGNGRAADDEKAKQNIKSAWFFVRGPSDIGKMAQNDPKRIRKVHAGAENASATTRRARI